MKENVKFYKCEICGNVIGLIDGNPEHIMCCGKNMERMEPNTVDAAQEKHVPVCKREGNDVLVQVGEINHPMDPDHYIMWVAQVTDNKTTRIRLHPGDVPQVKFNYEENAVIYAYCNKHGLWKTEC